MSSQREIGCNPLHNDDPDQTLAAADSNNCLLLPKPTAAEVRACQFSSWYYTFRNMDVASVSTSVSDNNNNDNHSRGNNHSGIIVNNTNNKKRNKLRKNITIESMILRPLPSEFIQYLLSDGVRLPECAIKVSSCMNDNQTTPNNDDDDDDDDDGNNSHDSSEDDFDDDENATEIKYNFPSLTQQIQLSINQLGNICMPKMNWSSPKDATWINCGTLKCSTPGDVYLLLKSSDFIVFDLEKAWEDLQEDNVDTTIDDDVERLEHLRIDESSVGLTTLGLPSNECTKHNINHQRHRQLSQKTVEHELILRKWCNLHPSMEFRCFIYEHELGELVFQLS